MSDPNKPRYVVGEPVPGGRGDYEISDTEKDKTLVLLWKDLPGGVDARKEAYRLCAIFNGETSALREENERVRAL